MMDSSVASTTLVHRLFAGVITAMSLTLAIAPIDARAASTPPSTTPITIASPADGTTFVAGSPLPITARLAPGLELNELGFSLGGIGYFDATSRDDRLYRFDYPLPAEMAGRVRITPVGRDGNGKLVQGVPVMVNVVPSGAVRSVTFMQRTHFLRPSTDRVRVILLAEYASQGADDDRVDVTEMGATFTSSDPAVITVDANGYASVVGAGTASVKGTFAGMSAFATFAVEDPEQRLPPQDLTSSVVITASDAQLDHATGHFIQTLTIRNQTANPLIAPLYLTLEELPQHVHPVIGTVGRTKNLLPLETLYIDIDLPDQTLAPGASVVVQLTFVNTLNIPISYVAKVFRISGDP
jgi:hypothetical protein